MRKTLSALLIAHLLVVSFQVPLRTFTIDTTYWRDLLLFPIVALALLYGVTHIPRRPSFHWLDVAVGSYVGYGLACFLYLWFVARGLGHHVTPDPIDFGIQYRTYFFPVALYFAARLAFRDAKDFVPVVNLFCVLALVYSADVIAEFWWIRVADLPSASIPWYQWFFAHDVRVIGNIRAEAPAFGASDPTTFNTVLGLYFENHYTAAGIAALALFVAPLAWIGTSERTRPTLDLWILRIPPWLRALLPYIGVLAVLMMAVRAPVVIVVAGFFLIAERGMLGRVTLLLGVAILAAILINPVRQALWRAYYEGFISNPALGGYSSLKWMLMFSFVFGWGPDPTLSRVLIGDLDLRNRGHAEQRILHFTSSYGVIWLTLLLLMFVLGMWYSWRRGRGAEPKSPEVLVSRGLLGFLFAHLMDAIHYSGSLMTPSIDHWAVALAGAVAVAHRALVPQRDVSRRGAPAIGATSGGG